MELKLPRNVVETRNK